MSSVPQTQPPSPELIFDTLNAKAALFAFEKYFEDTGRRVPIMVSVTITELLLALAEKSASAEKAPAEAAE